MNQINKFIAKKSTLVFGTMWMCYAFIIYGLLPLIPQLQSYQNILMYWSTWVQLWALPLIIVGQNVLNEMSETRAQEDHQMIIAEFEKITNIISLLQSDVQMQRDETSELTSIISENAELYKKLDSIEHILKDANNNNCNSLGL